MLAYFVYVVGVLAAVRALRARHLRPVVCVGAMAVLAFGLATALTLSSRLTLSSPRPRAFPAGVSVAFAVAFGVLLFLDRRLGLCLAAAATLAGMRRPGDVAAAVGIAALAAFAVFVSDRGASTVVAGDAAESLVGVPRPRGATPRRRRLTDRAPAQQPHS